jgi:hypothetical protein
LNLYNHKLARQTTQIKVFLKNFLASFVNIAYAYVPRRHTFSRDDFLASLAQKKYDFLVGDE